VWPKRVSHFVAAKPLQRTDEMTITMIGHASVLVQISNCNILIDPVWSDRASPFSWMGPKRFNEPAIALADLPPIDAVLLTHNHYDHMDRRTLNCLEADHQPHVITPLGNDALIKDVFPSFRIRTGDWESSFDLINQVQVKIVPAYHWSARRIGDRRMALWGGFIIRAPNGLIYNVGDSGYGNGQIFKNIKTHVGNPDVAIIPIGAYEPRWFMKDQHVNPEEAVRIMQDCGAKQGLGVHWGTFQLTDEAYLAPKEELAKAMRHANMRSDQFIPMEPGDVWMPKI
jgi:L-ascorbate metabolism protein UlaG (beta-lactamase superfamily)